MQPKPFKVEARIDIPVYDGSVDVEKVDSWLSQLETDFHLYGYSSEDQVSFARLKLTSHALAWWNSDLQTHREDEVTWQKLTELLRKEFDLMGYEEDRWRRWHNLRQKGDQSSVLEYTTEFRRLAASLGVSMDDSSTLMKYISGLLASTDKHGVTTISSERCVRCKHNCHDYCARRMVVESGPLTA